MHHYTWLERDDFSGGMWSSTDWVIPDNGLAVMEDCYPLPSGGIRAFAKFSSYTTTGIGAGEEPIGGYVEQAGNNLGTGPASDLYLLTSGHASGPRLYRIWEGDDPAPTGWTLIKQFGAGTATFGDFTSYKMAAVTEPYRYLAFNMTGAGSADKGLWRIPFATTQATTPVRAVTGQAGTFALPIGVHQDRLIFNDAFGGAKFWFTNPGVETVAAGSFKEVQPYTPRSGHVFFKSFAPSDLLVAKEGSQWVLMQGDISSTTSQRTMGDVRHANTLQRPAETEQGIVFQALMDGIYITPDGQQMNKISEAISADDLWNDELRSQPGYLAHLDNWLFTPSGHVYDFRTGAWFSLTDWTTSASAFVLMTDKRKSRHRLLAFKENGAGVPQIYYFDSEESGMARKSDYRIKWGPLHDDSGRQIEIGEVHVVLRCYQSGASMEVTINGVTRTISNISSGRTVVPAMFRERGPQLDIEIELHSNDAAIEAPSIEAIRVGVLKGHLLRTS